MNRNAGYDITHYIRGRGLNNIPILVLSSASSAEKEYVAYFPLVASTTSWRVLLNYIRGLALQLDDSNDWEGLFLH